MVRSDEAVSGVMFTIDTVSITGSYGLAEPGNVLPNICCGLT